MEEAYYWANRSRDPSTQNGAIIIGADDDLGVIGVGWNDFPRKIARTEAREDRAQKLRHTVHAEHAAILNAAFNGYTTAGATLYACWASCGPCALAIVQAGIKEVVVNKRHMDATPERWRAEVDFGLSLLAEAGVVVTRYEGGLPYAPGVRFDGRMWRP